MIITIILTLALAALVVLSLVGTYYLRNESKHGWEAAALDVLGSVISAAAAVTLMYLVAWMCAGETVHLLTREEWQAVQKVRKERHIIQLKKELSELEGRNPKAVQ